MAPIKFEEQLKEKLDKRTLSPSVNSWSKLGKRLDEEENKSKNSIYLWLSIAAGLLIMLAVSVQFFSKNGDETTLQEFPFDLKKSKFRVTNLVLPLHLEFGPSKKRDYKDRLRYTTDNQFRIGISGFGGVRLASLQKLIYEDEDGNRVKTKERRNFNASNSVYGLSGYIGLGDLAIYAKYDLSPLFQDQVLEQNNISLGLRWDLD